MKKIGPNMEPCGTPLVTSIKSDASLLIFTLFAIRYIRRSIELSSLQRQCYEAFVSEYYAVQCQTLLQSQDIRYLGL